MNSHNPIINPSDYLKKCNVERSQFRGLCHVFFNEAYIKLLSSKRIEHVISFKAVKIYNIYYPDNKKSYIAIIRNGASLAAVDFESLIYIGFTDFIFYGYACSIRNGDEIGNLLLVNQAFIGEGVSQYYENKDKSINLINNLTGIITEKLQGLYNFRLANCYTTEALFMETYELVHKLDKKGLDCIDMECSALSTIAHYRQVNAAFIFCVSDMIVDDKWICNIEEINLRDRLLYSMLVICQ